MTAYIAKVLGAAALIVIGILFVGTPSKMETVQRGYPGTGMVVIKTTDEVAEAATANADVPVALPPASGDGLKAAEAYENVQVLGNVTTGQFTRLMTSLTGWVSPEQGCEYCHNTENMAQDEGLHAKYISRRMIQMTQYINANWESHVGKTGVTCYTCHRGQPVPKYYWYEEPQSEYATRMLGNPAGQNVGAPQVAYASLPNDPFTPYLDEEENIRIIGPTPLPTGNRKSIKQAEWTYGLMMHMSESLGVNCTYCHNSRAFAEWEQSPPARSVAWYGIRMVRALNEQYIEDPSLQEHFAGQGRLGPTGDVPKINCTTCHQGVYKPLLGANMLKDFMATLSGPTMYDGVPSEPEPEAETETGTTAAEAETATATTAE